MILILVEQWATLRLPPNRTNKQTARDLEGRGLQVTLFCMYVFVSVSMYLSRYLCLCLGIYVFVSVLMYLARSEVMTLCNRG